MTDTARPALTITVGGLAGTGTSTLCGLLSERLGLPYEYAGRIFRQEAARRGLTLEQFGALCEQDPAVDQTLDDRQVDLLRAGGVLLEGRMAGWLAQHHALGAFTVWVTCDEHERIRRITEREGGDHAEQRARTLAREASEQERFLTYHGADLSDLSHYTLLLDSTATSPEDLADQVVARLRADGRIEHVPG